MVSIFSSHEAATKFQLPGPERVQGNEKWANELRAVYFFENEKHIEYMDLLPLGFYTPRNLSVRINLPISSAPDCPLEMKGRCLLLINKPQYPIPALTRHVSGTLELAATISYDGAIEELRVVSASVAPGAESRVLERAALANLRSWRFDRSQQQQSFQIQYSYRLTNSPSVNAAERFEIRLPTEILIEALSVESSVGRSN
ncbi:MAG: TonB family protein [Candidatus Acidiferrales bacterium]